MKYCMKVKRKARNEETYEKYETSPRKQLQKQDSTLRVLEGALIMNIY